MKLDNIDKKVIRSSFLETLESINQKIMEYENEIAILRDKKKNIAMVNKKINKEDEQ